MTRNGNCLYIVTGNFIDADTRALAIGGTETYTLALLGVATEMGWQSVVLQRGAQVPDISGPLGSRVMTWQSAEGLRATLRHLKSQVPGVAVTYQDLFSPEPADQPIVLIDHGVTSDGTCDARGRAAPVRLLADVRRVSRRVWSELSARRRLSRYSRVVCVDTNSINVLRNALPMYDWSGQLEYIPNFAALPAAALVDQKWESRDERFAVLFARRFQFHRGAELWLRCLEDLAPDFPGVQFRVVGFGQPWEGRFQKLARRFTNVRLGCRTAVEMRGEYLESHVSVVPSLWSEGTSLSAIESMAAGCCVVASNVGGLCNVVIPGFNGCLVPPLRDVVRESVRALLHDRDRAMRYGLNGYSMAQASFSVGSWQARMVETLERSLAEPAGIPIPRRRCQDPPWSA